MVGRDARINLLISTGHFLSHFYQLCLPPLFLVWQRQFDISFAELGLSVVLMTGTAAVLQTPVGFLVDRYGAPPFLIGGALVMSIAIALMAFASAFWQILALALISGIGNSVFHPATTRSLRIDPQGTHGPLLRPARLQRQYRFCARAADDRGAAECHGLARRPPGGGRSRPAGGRGRHRPEPHPARPSAQGHARARHVDARCCSTGRSACSSCSISSAPWRAAA